MHPSQSERNALMNDVQCFNGGVVVHREVRKQTCDLITLLEMAQPLSHYYLFMEDDFR